MRRKALLLGFVCAVVGLCACCRDAAVAPAAHSGTEADAAPARTVVIVAYSL